MARVTPSGNRRTTELKTRRMRWRMRPRNARRAGMVTRPILWDGCYPSPGMSSARDIRVIVSDVDGVWTDGKITYAGDRSEIKSFNVRDGLGAKLAQRAGITIVLLT